MAPLNPAPTVTAGLPARRHCHATPAARSWTDRLELLEARAMDSLDGWMNDHPAVSTAIAAISLAAVAICTGTAVFASSI